MALPFQFKTETIITQGKTTQATVDAIKSWLNTTKLPPFQEEFIILFLMSCENDTDRVKKTMENYFKIKSEAPDMFDKFTWSNKEITNILKVLGICVVSTRTDHNSVVLFSKLFNTNYRNFDLLSALRVSVICLEFSLINNPPKDIIIVADMKGVGLMHLTRLKINPTISFLRYLQEGLPLRIAAIHILNTNYVFDRALNLFRMCLSNEFMARIKTHSCGMDMEKFHEHYVPPSCLPKEYGGDLAPFEQLVDEFNEEIKKSKPFFDAEEEFRKSYAT